MVSGRKSAAALVLWLWLVRGAAQDIGVLTMHSKEILGYANYSAAINQIYSAKWGYAFHICDHLIDTQRVPIWSKFVALTIWLPEHDFLFWIDADAVFFDESRSLGDVFNISTESDIDIWVPSNWVEYPSVHRKELIDTGTMLLRNSAWTRMFLVEFYHYPGCLKEIELGDQYCFSVAYRDNLMNMQQRVKVLPPGIVNHYMPSHPKLGFQELYILHMSGKSNLARAEQFKQLWSGSVDRFYTERLRYASFWSFYGIFQGMETLAQMHTCVFGLGRRLSSFLDALLFHLPYHKGLAWLADGSPGVWTAATKTFPILEMHYPDRALLFDFDQIQEMSARPILHCDMLVLGVESYRQLKNLEMLFTLSLRGLSDELSEDGFPMPGRSVYSEVVFVFLYEDCNGGAGVQAASSLKSAAEPSRGILLDGDDKDGADLKAACTFVSKSHMELAELRWNSAAGSVAPVFADDVAVVMLPRKELLQHRHARRREKMEGR